MLHFLIPILIVLFSLIEGNIKQGYCQSEKCFVTPDSSSLTELTSDGGKTCSSVVESNGHSYRWWEWPERKGMQFLFLTNSNKSIGYYNKNTGYYYSANKDGWEKQSSQSPVDPPNSANRTTGYAFGAQPDEYDPKTTYNGKETTILEAEKLIRFRRKNPPDDENQLIDDHSQEELIDDRELPMITVISPSKEIRKESFEAIKKIKKEFGPINSQIYDPNLKETGPMIEDFKVAMDSPEYKNTGVVLIAQAGPLSKDAGKQIVLFGDASEDAQLKGLKIVAPLFHLQKQRREDEIEFYVKIVFWIFVVVVAVFLVGIWIKKHKDED